MDFPATIAKKAQLTIPSEMMKLLYLGEQGGGYVMGQQTQKMLKLSIKN